MPLYNEDKIMVSPVILAKEHPDIPDCYGIKIVYITGGDDKFEVVKHFPIKDGFIEFWDTDEQLHLIPISSIKNLTFDKRWTKLIELNAKREKNEPIS